MENDMKVQRFDSLPLDATYFTDEGYLVDHPIVTSVGIFVYHNPDGSERRELRLPEEVFAEKSLASYKGKPIIVTHDAGYVDTDNVKDESIGTILSEGYRDGDDVRAEIIIHDTDSLKKYKMRELSCGYNLRLDETPGVWEGQPYDAIQRDIEIAKCPSLRWPARPLWRSLWQIRFRALPGSPCCPSKVRRWNSS